MRRQRTMVAQPECTCVRLSARLEMQWSTDRQTDRQTAV